MNEICVTKFSFKKHLLMGRHKELSQDLHSKTEGHGNGTGYQLISQLPDVHISTTYAQM